MHLFGAFPIYYNYQRILIFVMPKEDAQLKQALVQGDDDYMPLYHKSKPKNFTKWTLEENLKYISFLKQSGEDFLEEHSRRVKKVFKNLAKFVGTRTQQQCKSHHQKMMAQYKSLEIIIANVEQRNENKMVIRQKIQSDTLLHKLMPRYYDIHIKNSIEKVSSSSSTHQFQNTTNKKEEYRIKTDEQRKELAENIKNGDDSKQCGQLILISMNNGQESVEDDLFNVLSI